MFGFFSLPARAEDEYIPLDVVVGKADRIVVGKVTAIGKPVEMTLETPDPPSSQKGWYHKFTVTVVRDMPSKGEKAARDETIEVLTPCADPNPKPPPAVTDPMTPVLPPQGAAPRFDNVIRSNKRYVFHSALIASSYLMLVRLGGRQEYYLSSYMLNFKPEADSSVKEAEKLATGGIESWSWGKTVHGLQAGFHLFAYAKIGDNSSLMTACVILRNTTDKPIAVNLYDMDRCLEITADAADKDKAVGIKLLQLETAPGDRVRSRWPFRRHCPQRQAFYRPRRPRDVRAMGHAAGER